MPSPSSVADTSKEFDNDYIPQISYRNCVVRTCPQPHETDESIRLFTFPKNGDTRSKWADNLQINPNDIQANHRVCERHFEPRCMHAHRLVEHAVPTLELGYDYPAPYASGLIIGKGWRKCCIRNCKSNENEVYHRFPKDGPIRNIWMKAIGLPPDTKDRYICGVHFDPEVGNRKKMPPTAVPMYYLGGEDCYSRKSPEDSDDAYVDYDANNYDFDPSISEEERSFYLKAYSTVEAVRDRKVHCTVCKMHIGTAPVLESSIKMHPILRVTHCMKCHDFYNSGEFSKGEDGSELYCRWCGQGGEVYCCSSCPYVFCKSCIVKNLSKGVVADIEQNENWNCFSCSPKILWPLRAQHWALMNYIDMQKKEISSLNLPEHEYKLRMAQDRSKCCRLAKSKCGSMSDSMESLDSVTSKRSHGSSGAHKKTLKHPPSTPSPQQPSAKRAKTNDEVVCTPDLMSMLEPDCQITVPQKSNIQRPMPSPSNPSPRVMSISTQNFGNSSTPKSSAPPPLVLRTTGIKLRPIAPSPIVRRTVIGPRAPTPGGNGAPVYHTINGFRIDLNSAAQQETFRLPNGKLIQVKRQGAPLMSGPQQSQSPNVNSWQMQTQAAPQPQQRLVPQTIASRPIQITPHPFPGANVSQTAPQHLPGARYHGNVIGSTTINAVGGHNGGPLHVINGQISAPQTPNLQHPLMAQQVNMPTGVPLRPIMVRHIFPDNAIGAARTQLQEEVFNAMEISTHLSNKVQTLTNSNAYKQAKNYLEIKELYIHLSYLLTYAIGRYKGLQDKCLTDMRKLGFGNDADCLENGQLAAAIDYVCYGQLDDVDLFNTGANSFHNQVYEYRKSLHANLKDGEDGAKSPLPPLFALGQGKLNDGQDEDEDSLLEAPANDFKGHWMEGGDDCNLGYGQENEENEEPDDNDDDDYSRGGGGYGSLSQGTEESMRRNEESHTYDRKLTRLISQYPSIWCTRHPDYGNFEVTRKHWRTIESHFARGENIKLRWKNIRKRFVRIEKRVAEGKRFNGHFDKAMAFLANRDIPEDQWLSVDCGEDDGDTYERQNLDAIEKSLHFRDAKSDEYRDPFRFPKSLKPIEIEPLDLKIITFVKTNPVLWRKSMDPEADKIDEQTRQPVWRQLAKSLKTISADYIRDRWQHLYEMYKTFRLKTIKSSDDRSNLELKYSKYLAKLYFLYKIDEQELRNENNGLFEDCFELDDEDEEEQEAIEQRDKTTTEEKAENADSGSEDQPAPVKLQDMPDDKEFLQKLVQYVREYPALWNTKHDDYNDIMVRDNYWQEIHRKLEPYKHKQASDDEDNEIEIVEPKADLINLDSDDDDEPSPPQNKTPAQIQQQQQPQKQIPRLSIVQKNIAPLPPLNMLPAAPRLPAPPVVQTTPIANETQHGHNALKLPAEEDFMSLAQSFLASMLEVDITEGSYNSQYSPTSGESTTHKKQPRKKLTNKPNPTLLKQKARMERERLEEIKRNDLKLKMKCSVTLYKAENEFPFVKEMLKTKMLQKQQQKEIEKNDQQFNQEEEKSTTVMLSRGKEQFEIQLVIEDEKEDSDILEKIINISSEDEVLETQSNSMEENDEETNTKTTEIENEKSIQLNESDNNISKANSNENVKENKNDLDESEKVVLDDIKKVQDDVCKEIPEMDENEIEKSPRDNEDEDIEMGTTEEKQIKDINDVQTKEKGDLTEDKGGVTKEIGDLKKVQTVPEVEVDKEEKMEVDHEEEQGDEEEEQKEDQEEEHEEKQKEDKAEEQKEDKEEEQKEDKEEEEKEDKEEEKKEDKKEEKKEDREQKKDQEEEEPEKEKVKEKEVEVEPEKEEKEDEETNEDTEDAEVYKEIEKVLQHRRDSETEEVVKNKIAVDNNIEASANNSKAMKPLAPEDIESNSLSAVDSTKESVISDKRNSIDSQEQSSAVANALHTTEIIENSTPSSQKITSNGNV